MIKRLTAVDFPKTAGVINAARLMEQMTLLRRVLYNNDKTVFHSTFSKWRKDTGSQGSETITQAQAMLIIFLGTYAKSGKLTYKKSANDLKLEQIPMMASRWLHDMAARMETPNQLPEDTPIYTLLLHVSEGQPSLGLLLKAIDNAVGTGVTDRKRVSLRTLQRRAKAKKLKLSLSQPLPEELVKGVFK